MDVEQDILQIEQLLKEQDAIYHAAAVKLGVSDTALWALCMLYESEQGCTQQELCQQFYFPKQTINAMIAGFVRKGIVRLEPIAGSRNRKRILLTEAGRALAENTAMPVRRAELRAYGDLSAQERESYLWLTRKLVSSLRREMEEI